MERPSAAPRLATFLALALLAAGCRTAFVTSVPDARYVDKYGNVFFEATSGAFRDAGFQCGDGVLLTVAEGETFEMAVVPNLHCASATGFALLAPDDPSRNLGAALFHGSFADLSLGADAATNAAAFPLAVRIAPGERGKFADSLVLAALRRSTNRLDYPTLDDAGFANFRPLAAPGIASATLYRASSPVDGSLGRAACAAALLDRHGIRSVWNMANTRDEAERLVARAKTGEAYFEREIRFLPMSADVRGEKFRRSVAEGMRFLIASKPPYLIHCKEGKDRTGFVAALLEAFAGATLEEIRADYARSWADFYGVRPGSKEWTAVCGLLDAMLKRAFAVESLDDARLREMAADYLSRQCGLDRDELDGLARAIGHGGGQP